MAKPTIVNLSGSAGNLIFYSFRGTPCVRTRPSRVRQSRGTKASAMIFGWASQLSSILRGELSAIIPEIKVPQIRYRMDNAVLQWLMKYEDTPGFTNVPHLTNLSLNTKLDFPARMVKPIAVDWEQKNKLVLTLPAVKQDYGIFIPAKAVAIVWKFFVTNCILKTLSVSSHYKIEVEIPVTEEGIPETRLELPFELKMNSINILASCLQYKVPGRMNQKILKDPKWMPSGILEARYKGN